MEKAMKSLLLAIPLALMSAPAGAHNGLKCMDAIEPGEPTGLSSTDCPATKTELWQSARCIRGAATDVCERVDRTDLKDLVWRLELKLGVCLPVKSTTGHPNPEKVATRTIKVCPGDNRKN